MTDGEYLAVIRQRREKAASNKKRSKVGDTEYWSRRDAAYHRAQKRMYKFESR